MAEEVGQAYVSIVPSLKGFSSKLRAELAGELRGIDAPISQAGHRAGQGFGDNLREGIRTRLAGIGAMLKTGLVVGVAAVAAGLGALTTFGLKSAAALEQTQIGIESLLGSADEATKFIGELQKFAAKTPFEFAGVADASKRILAFGQAVGITRDEVIPTLSTVGDLVSVLGGGQESIDSVLRAFGQISSKGRVQQEELLQLAEALPGFNANLAIAKALGLSVPDAMAKITAGGVDATTGINALLAGMQAFPGAAGAMEKQSQTLLGVFSTFKDTIGIALTAAFQPVIPEIKQALSDVTPVLGEAIGQLAPLLGQVLTTVLPLVANLITALVPIITPVLDAISQTIDALAPALQPLGDALGQIVSAVAPLLPVIGKFASELVLALVPAITALVPHLDSLVPAIGDLLLALIPVLPPLGELLALWVQSQVPLTELIVLLTELLLTKALVPVLNALATALQAIADFARPIIEFSDSLDEMQTNLGTVGEVFKRAWDGIVERVRAVPGEILGFLQSLPDRIQAWASDLFNRLTYAIGFGIGTVLVFFRDAPGKIVAFLKELPGQVSAFFVDAFNRSRDGAQQRLGEIVEFAKALPGRIADFVKELPPKLATAFTAVRDKVVQIGRDIVSGVVDGIKSAAGSIKDALVGGFRNALQGVRDALGIHSPSRVYMQVGENTVAGYIEGVERSARDAAAAQVAALGPAAGSSPSTVAPAPQSVRVDSSDPVIQTVMDRIREAVRTQFGNDVTVALQV